MPTIASIDKLFTQATESKAMPGIVAVAATDNGTVYEGAFGRARARQGRADDARLGRLDRVDDQGHHGDGGDAARRARQAEPRQSGERRGLGAWPPPRYSTGSTPTASPVSGAPRRPITLRHLMTHTAGFAYEIWRPAIASIRRATDTPGITTCTNAALTTPLLFDPGDRWEYGISIDWVGKMVETTSGQKLDRYFQDNIFGPLGMTDTAFKLSPAQRGRLASVHQRDDKGALTPIEFALPEDPEFLMGGGGLYGTARDYLAFTQMILQGGTAGRRSGAAAARRSTSWRRTTSRRSTFPH